MSSGRSAILKSPGDGRETPLLRTGAPPKKQEAHPRTALLAGILFISLSLILGLREFPKTTLLVADFLICLYFYKVFPYRLRGLFLLHPAIVWLVGAFYQDRYVNLGDGRAYFEVTRWALSYYTGKDHWDYIFSLIKSLNFKVLYFGFIPNALIPDMLYGSPEDIVYFYWQHCFYLFMLAVCLRLTLRWRSIRSEYLYPLILFSAISPSFFELLASPTRHHVTYIAIFLFYSAFIAVNRRMSADRILWLSFAIALVAVSRIGYFIPITMFSLYFLFFEKGKSKSAFSKLLLGTALLVFIFLSASFFQKKVIDYSYISRGGAATFGGLARLPGVSVFAKYVFALLSPFPWQKAMTHIHEVWGGNPLLFFLHVSSSLFGIHFFLQMAVYWKKIIKDDPELRWLLALGLIMSLSIVRGATGFHGYLAIFFPFFSPLLVLPRFRLSPWIAVGTAFMFEVMYTAAVGFN